MLIRAQPSSLIADLRNAETRSLNRLPAPAIMCSLILVINPFFCGVQTMTDTVRIVKISVYHSEAFGLHLLECFFFFLLKFQPFEGHCDRGNAKCSPTLLLLKVMQISSLPCSYVLV